MAKQKVTLTNKSIRSGVTHDACKAVCEFIWNGFDAHAKHVSVLYDANEMGTILSLTIRDDGDGIDRRTLSDTFGRYQDSVKKKSFQWSSQVKGHKGKGRYAFNCFASAAKWITVYRDGDNLLRHLISIDSGENDQYNDHADDGSLQVVHNTTTGTEVQFINVTLTAAFFESEDFIKYLQREFAVFLKLNENRGCKLDVNGKYIDYNILIAESETMQIPIRDDSSGFEYHFVATFIRWHDKMKENYRFYYLNEEGIESYEETTSLNKKDTGFHHSVYISSSYFEHFVCTLDSDGDSLEQGSFEFEEPRTSEKDKVFRDLKMQVSNWLSEKQKVFITEVGGKELWTRYENSGVVVLPKNEFEEPLFYELKETVIGIYSVQPRIFQNLKDDQAKALVGCVKLLLQTDKRDDIITILEGITKMSDEERHKLAQILKTTELSSITKMIDMLENRMRTASALRSMVFDSSLKAYEVDDIQRIVGSAFWLFGEQYNIVTEAEPDFQQALELYLKKIHEETNGVSKSAFNKEKIDNPDVNKEMDVFAFRQNQESHTIENIVVELKRPNVKLGEIELSQVKTYMRLIYGEDRFNSPNAKWTFLLVGNDFDKSGYVEGEIESNKAWGKDSLVYRVDRSGQNYEIFVKKWSTIFDDFEMRHKFLFDRLNAKRELLTVKYKNKQDLHAVVEIAKEK